MTWLAEGRGGCRGAVGNLKKYPIEKSENGVGAGAIYKRTLSCYTQLPAYLDDVPADSPTGYMSGWTNKVNDKYLETVRVQFGVIEEDGFVKIDYLELFPEGDPSIPITPS